MSGSQRWTVRRTWRSAWVPVRRVLTLHDTPERIARGSAAGMLCAYLPTVGQSLLGMAVAWLLRGSLLAAVPWSWITNPFTTLPIWYGSYRLGAWLLGRDVQMNIAGLRAAQERLSQLGLWDGLMQGAGILGGMFWPMLLGSLVIGAVTAVPTWWLVRRGVAAVQARRARRAAEWRARLARPPSDATT